MVNNHFDVINEVDALMFVDYWEENSDDDPGGWAGIGKAGEDPENSKCSGIVDTNYSSYAIRHSGYEGIAFHELLHIYNSTHDKSSTYYDRNDRYSAIWAPGVDDIGCNDRTDALYHSFEVSDCTRSSVRNYIDTNNLS